MLTRVTRYVMVDRKRKMVYLVDKDGAKTGQSRTLGLLEDVVGKVPDYYKVTYRRGAGKKGSPVGVSVGTIFKGMGSIKQFFSACVCFMPGNWNTVSEFGVDRIQPEPVTREITVLDKEARRVADIR